MKFKNLISKLKSKISFFYGRNKKLFIASLALIVFVIVCLFFIPTNKEDSKIIEETKRNENVTTASYSKQIEAKIENMLLSLSEVNFANVMVVCDSTEVYEYLKNVNQTKSENGNITIQEEVVYEKNGSNTKPIIITAKSPKILGVWVVINAVSPSTKLAIANSLKTVLNIDESCINILQER